MQQSINFGKSYLPPQKLKAENLNRLIDDRIDEVNEDQRIKTKITQEFRKDKMIEMGEVI